MTLLKTFLSLVITLKLLQEFNNKIEHRSGVKMKYVDALSRAGLQK